MIIALTGTPGTGKTSVAEELEGFDTLDLTEFVKERKLGEKGDEFEVNLEAMVEELKHEINDKENVLIEGHLSHHFPADFCIVLRCNPEELQERLSEREYSEEKVEENIESEILDIILGEAVSQQENIIEVDTTGRKSGDVAEEVERRINEEEVGYGDIDWTGYL